MVGQDRGQRPMRKPYVRKETDEARKQRLINQAVLIRAAQAKKKTERHVCKSGDIDEQYVRLLGRLRRVAPANIAPYPISMMWDINESQWLVDLHVRIEGITEYELTGVGATLASAIANANNAIIKQKFNERLAAKDKESFNVTGRARSDTSEEREDT